MAGRFYLSSWPYAVATGLLRDGVARNDSVVVIARRKQLRRGDPVAPVNDNVIVIARRKQLRRGDPVAHANQSSVGNDASAFNLSSSHCTVRRQASSAASASYEPRSSQKKPCSAPG